MSPCVSQRHNGAEVKTRTCMMPPPRPNVQSEGPSGSQPRTTTLLLAITEPATVTRAAELMARAPPAAQALLLRSSVCRITSGPVTDLTSSAPPTRCAWFPTKVQFDMTGMTPRTADCTCRHQN